MIINDKKFSPIDTVEKITIADSFVVSANKLGTAHGESKFYIGNKNQELWNFYGLEGFDIRCFFLKNDLINFIDELKDEYKTPELPYRGKEEFPQLFKKRKEKILSMDSIIWFKIKQQKQIQGPRVYVNSEDDNYQILRELALPNLSYLSILKLQDKNGEIIYNTRLFTDYENAFNENQHPNTRKREKEKIENNEELSKEERYQLVRARNGQGRFREKLLDECGFCPFTHVSDDRLLIASHIKPWTQSDREEKIDPKNGFMFTRTYDHLFDKGFISFENNKKIMISPWLSKITLTRLNLHPNKTIEQLQIIGRETYLDYHRKNIFKS